MKRLRDEIRMLPALESRLQGLEQRAAERISEADALLVRLRKEQRDVENIRKENLTSFVLRLAGKYEDRLDKELQEELNAKAAYDSAVSAVETLRGEIEGCKRRIAELRGKERRYRQELDRRRNLLARRAQEPDGRAYFRLEEERDRMVRQLTEVEEAWRVAVEASQLARDVAESLRSADGWATYDLWAGGGLITHAAKYSHIDQAESDFLHLLSLLAELRAELRDVQDLDALVLSEISCGQRAVDYFFDNIFTDLSVQSQIRDNQERTERALREVEKIQGTLRQRMEAIRRRLADNRVREEAFLVSLGESTQDAYE